MASSAALTTTHLPRLRAQLDEWRQKQRAPSLFTTPLTAITARFPQGNSDARGKDVIVSFRTRPPLENEAEEKFKAYDTEDADPAPVHSAEGEQGEDAQAEAVKVEFCPGITVADAEPGAFVAHVPGYKWSGPTLTHKPFGADLAFGPDNDNEEVYQRTVIANDMIQLGLSSGTACILAYGQTGSGKTFTMEGLEFRIARDLFVVADHVAKRLRGGEGAEEGATSGSAGTTYSDVFEFSVTFLELLGKRAVDLLEPEEGLPVDAAGNPIRKEVPVQEDKNGDVRPRLISRTVETSEQLQRLITAALAHRRTSATLRNATSSRSHAVLTIRIKNKLMPYSEEGQIILVDLAGSERYEDSKAHDKQRMLESRENNNSLMHLKECVRAKAKMANEDGFVHIPWRGNKLTMLLKSIFDPENRQPSKTLIIAHVSPHIQDSTHSVNTLSYAAPFKMAPPKPRGPAPYNPEDPRTWDHARTQTWLTEEFTKRAQARRAHSHKVREQKAAKEKKKIKPLDESVPVALAVKVDRVCPEGMTAKNIGAMYTTEFVQLCLDAGNVGGDVTADVVRNTAAEVMGRLSYLIMTAKTKGRREIMKSRKKLTLEAYGETPFEVIPGTNERMPDLSIPHAVELKQYSHDQFRAAATAYGAAWYDIINTRIVLARMKGEDQEETRVMAIVDLMDMYVKNGNSLPQDYLKVLLPHVE